MKKKSKGFTLIEVSVVVVLLAIIASLVIPSYRKLIGKARQTEAKVILESIYSAQKLYFNENNAYSSDIKKLSIEIPDDSKYTYSSKTQKNGFTVTAKGNIDGDDKLDTWTINEKRELKNTLNDIYE